MQAAGGHRVRFKLSEVLRQEVCKEGGPGQKVILSGLDSEIEKEARCGAAMVLGSQV